MHFEPALGDTFEAYQKATEDVVHWVATTARATGTVDHLFDHDATTARRSLIQKFKDRSTLPRSLMGKSKRRHRNQTYITTNAASHSIIRLSYKTLGRLGKAIANADNTEVDYNVLVVLKGVIHARKGFAT